MKSMSCHSWWLAGLLLVVLVDPATAQEATAAEEPIAPLARGIEMDEAVTATPAASEQPNVSDPVTPDGAAALPTRSASAAERFLAAVAASEDGRAEQAVEGFLQLLEEGFDDGRLHYNLGNAQLRSGRLGAAVASYRRALERRPRDSDAAANLAFARKTARDAIAPPGAPAVARALAFWHFWLSAAELRWLLVTANVLAWTLAGVWLVRRRGEVLRWLVIASFGVVVLLAASVVADSLFAPRTAVVVPAAVDVVAGPALDAVLRFELHAGAEVRLIEERDGWLRVSLPDGQQGWVPSEAAEVVAGWR